MKSKELLLKHLALHDCKGYVTSDGRLYKAIIDALEEAINYTHCCESDSELLAEHKCKFYVNADWSYLRCDCGKRIKKVFKE